MALPSVGGGYQIGDGNLNEPEIVTVPAPATATDSATLTSAQLTNGILIGTPTTTAAYTLPLASLTTPKWGLRLISASSIRRPRASSP